MNDEKLTELLTYAGSLPFIACALLPLLGVDTIPPFGRFDVIAVLYGLTIASFMAGTHWGTYLYNRASSPANLLITSNVVALSCWFAILLAGTVMTLFVMIFAFAYLLFVDLGLVRVRLITENYFQMRLRVTLIVEGALVLTLVQAAGLTAVGLTSG